MPTCVMKVVHSFDYNALCLLCVCVCVCIESVGEKFR